VLFGAIVGLGVGYYLWNVRSHDPRYKLASHSQVQQAKEDITHKFLAVSSTECTDPSDPVKPNDRIAVFKKYLKVNKYANRAVIRSCNNIDNLLAKDPISGQWQQTSINVALDSRANPAWQVECLIDDITKADDVVRPENSSIDAYNLVGCRILKEKEQIVDILIRSGTLKRDKITQQDIDAYIKGGEEFLN
jgi:hypothetical protein